MINEGYDPGTYVFFQNVSSTTTINSLSNVAEISAQLLITENKAIFKNLNVDPLDETHELDVIEHSNLIIDENNKDVDHDISINDAISKNTSEVRNVKTASEDTAIELINENKAASPKVINIEDDTENKEVDIDKINLVKPLNNETPKIVEKSKTIQKTTEQDLAASVWIRGISNTTKAADLKVFKLKFIF